MPAGRPRKPVEQKKFEGTYRKDRDAGRELVEKKINEVPGLMFEKEAKISCPKTIKSRYCKSYWKTLTKNLINLQQLSYNDIPQVENMIIILERLRKAQERLAEYEAFEKEDDFENYESCLRVVSKLTQLFNEMASKYFISPAARSKLTLEALNVVKTEQEIKQRESGINAVMNLRKAQ